MTRGVGSALARRDNAADIPLSNLYVSMFQGFGTPVERFADSTGPRRGVLT